MKSVCELCKHGFKTSLENSSQCLSHSRLRSWSDPRLYYPAGGGLDLSRGVHWEDVVFARVSSVTLPRQLVCAELLLRALPLDRQ